MKTGLKVCIGVVCGLVIGFPTGYYIGNSKSQQEDITIDDSYGDVLQEEVDDIPIDDSYTISEEEEFQDTTPTVIEDPMVFLAELSEDVEALVGDDFWLDFRGEYIFAVYDEIDTRHQVSYIVMEGNDMYQIVRSSDELTPENVLYKWENVGSIDRQELIEDVKFHLADYKEYLQGREYKCDYTYYKDGEWVKK